MAAHFRQPRINVYASNAVSMLVISSLAEARAEVAARKPARAISILSEEEATPNFGLQPDRHLKLYVARESCARSIVEAGKARAAEIIRFLNDWDGQGDMLVHCNRGISRSAAAAYIVMCARAPGADEAELASALRRAAPYADPCPMLVDCADELLGRDGRMSDAICALSPPATAIAAPTAVINLDDFGAKS